MPGGGLPSGGSGGAAVTVVTVIPNGGIASLERARDHLVIATDSGIPIEPPPPSTVNLPAEPVAGDRVVIKRTATPEVLVQCAGVMTIEGVVPSLEMQSASGLDTWELEADPARNAWRILGTWDLSSLNSATPAATLYRFQQSAAFLLTDGTPVPIDGSVGSWQQESSSDGITPQPASGTIQIDGNACENVEISYSLNLRPDAAFELLEAWVEMNENGAGWSQRTQTFSEARYAGDPALSNQATMPLVLTPVVVGIPSGITTETRLVVRLSSSLGDINLEVYHAHFNVRAT